MRPFLHKMGILSCSKCFMSVLRVAKMVKLNLGD